VEHSTFCEDTEKLKISQDFEWLKVVAWGWKFEQCAGGGHRQVSVLLSGSEGTTDIPHVRMSWKCKTAG
jgi:hypothetical protein